ncbi:MAG: SLBB domain-containing protein, partial [Candidatus Acidiferrales bacterium]
MYLQASPQPPAPERFGMEVFENGTRDLQMIPMDLPVGPDYVVGPGDGLAIDLWGGVSQRIVRTVDREGRLSLPEVGPVLVSGKSMAEVQQTVQRTLRSQFRDVSADVSLSRLRSIRVYVVGDVAHPGAYDISSLSTPLNAIFAAGGPTERGSLRNLEHYRGKQLMQNVDVYDLLLHGVKTDIERLENGDTVLVPPIGGQVSVEGMVRRPSIYELKGEKSLASVLELAGGLLPTATLRHIEVQRIVAHDKRTMLSLDVPESISKEGDSAAITKQIDSFEVQDGDKIRIFPIAPYSQDTIYLEGHALRPGRYSYHAGMRVTDLISSYKDLLPEPATQYAEIIRLNPPDYRPVVESFNLAEALSHPASSPILDPLDTVQIFGRYDFENPPTVSVWGDVRDPGTYRSSGEIHLSDAIHMAGGLGPDAEREDAQVFRYLPDGELKIFSVRLSNALDGNPLDNIVLNSRDRILVHGNPAEVDPATVYIKGEVARPGRYPLTTNMSIADLIRSAGGLQQSADVKSADLTRYQWTKQGQMTGQHKEIELATAMSGARVEDDSLHNGDVLTIRQLPGWNDLGATIQLRGAVKHPGSYGIQPGERLSSVLKRAGAFMPDAYPYGAVLIRPEVRDLEDRSHSELVERVREQQVSLKLASTTATDPDVK